MMLNPESMSHALPEASGGKVAPDDRAYHAARRTSDTVRPVPIAPAFCTHLPTARPRMFAIVMTARHPKATSDTNHFSARRSGGASLAYAATPAMYTSCMGM